MFDSGFGGLTVARAVIDLMPAEDLVYIGDTGRYPYGPKPRDEVRGYAAELLEGLGQRSLHRHRRLVRCSKKRRKAEQESRFCSMWRKWLGALLRLGSDGHHRRHPKSMKEPIQPPQTTPGSCAPLRV